jgi:two-component system sensor histidine kinase BaeS
VTVTPDFTVASSTGVGPSAELQHCLAEERAQLKPYVAPPALLFVTGAAAPAPDVALSTGDALRIAGTTTLVLLIACVATVLVGRRLVRPLRTLTDAAHQDRRQRPRSGDRPAPRPYPRR